MKITPHDLAMWVDQEGGLSNFISQHAEIELPDETPPLVRGAWQKYIEADKYRRIVAGWLDQELQNSQA